MPTIDANMNHSYEEIRNAALDVLAGRMRSSYSPDQYSHLMIGVAEVFVKQDLAPGQADLNLRAGANLTAEDRELFLEVFWDLFRQGIITLGMNDSNREFPFFRVSSFGRRVLDAHESYFFHDVSSYTNLITNAIPNIDRVTLIYLQEAMQAFRSGCILSCSVMLGVATEHTFLLLMETVDNNVNHASIFAAVAKERTILRKVNKFRNILDQQLGTLPSDINEDLDTNFAGILSVIRTFRNASGHPSGQIIDREQAYVLLQLFIPYARKMYQLIAYYK